MVRQKIFSTQSDELLIELVRENCELYDFSHRLYSDTPHKSTIWQQIGETLQLDPQECKHRWEAIRGQYRKYIVKAKTTTGQAATDVRYKYADALEFLKPHMKDKERVTSLAGSSSTDAVEASDTEDTQEMYIPVPVLESDESNLSTTQAQVSTQRVTPTTSFLSQGVKRQPESQTPSGALMHFLLEEGIKKRKTEAKDELDYFFDTLKCTVRKFSEIDRHIVKQKLFMIVSEMEGEYLQRTSQEYRHQPLNQLK